MRRVRGLAVEAFPMAVRKEDLVRFLRGQQAASQAVEAEQARTLPTLSVAEARREYEDLCRVWYGRPHEAEVDPERLDALLRIRRVLARQSP